MIDCLVIQETVDSGRTSPPIYVTCKIVSPSLIPSKFKPPFTVSISFQAGSDCLTQKSQEFHTQSKWKSTDISFSKTWQSEFRQANVGKNCYFKFSKIDYKVIDSRGRVLISYGEPQSPLKRLTGQIREAVLLVTPEFKPNGSSKIDHEVVLIEAS